MSTSDAGELAPRVVGGESTTPLSESAQTTTARAQQNEEFESVLQENHHDDKTTTGPDSRLSAIAPEGTHKALTFGADRLRKVQAYCGDSEVQTQKHAGPRFTSCLFLTPSNNLSLEKQEQKLNTPKSSQDSLIEPQWTEPEDSRCQVNQQSSPYNTSIKTNSPYPDIPFRTRKKDDNTVVSNVLETTRDLSTNHYFSNRDSGSHECNDLHRIPFGLRRIGSGSVTLEEDIKDLKKHKNHKNVTMLSSTVVTVLAPHWSGRRRTKRFEGTNTSEGQGAIQDVAKSTHHREQQYSQETQSQHIVESVLPDRALFLGTRSNAVGWSSSSGPASLDYEYKRKIIQTVSLDVNSGRPDNKETDAGTLNPVNTTASPLSFNPNDQRRTQQTVHQVGPPTLSSKPTTSSMLLSLRRCNSSGRSSNAASSLSKPFSLNSLHSDQDGKLGNRETPITQTFLNKNEQENSKPLFSPSFISNKTAETGQVLSSLSSSHRERNMYENLFFSSLSINKDTESQSSLARSKHSFQSRGPSEKQDTNTNLFSENLSSPTHSPNDYSALLKKPLFSRRTNLTSKSWWKQDNKEDLSSLTTSDATNNKDKQNTPTVQVCNDYSYLASPLPTDKKSVINQTSNNRDNNNTTESVCKGNMNFAMKKPVKQTNTEELPDHGSDQLVKQQYGSNFKNKPQEPYGLPSTLSCSKISSTAGQTLGHSKDHNKLDQSNASFTDDLSPTLLNPMSSNAHTEASGTFNNNHCSSRCSNIITSLHNKESEKFTKQPVSLASTMTVSGQTFTSKPTSALPPSPNTKTSSSFYSHSVSSQTNKHISSHTGSSFHTPKYINAANPTPLGFERSYASSPKPFCPKPVSSLIPRVSGFSKTNSTPVSTPSISASATSSHPTATTVHSLCLTSPVITSPTPVTISSLLTPPATPVITSHNYSEMSSTNERKFSSSPDREKKKLLVEGKKARRVTWEDSVDLQHSETILAEKQEPVQVPTNPLSPSRSPRSVSTPSIFSFLRSSSLSKSTSPLCSPTPKPSSIQVGTGGKFRSLSSDSADLISREQERTKHRPSDAMIFNRGKQDFTTPRQERTQSVETDTVQYRSSAPLSLPADFSSGYKLRYSSPPYTRLVSSRSTQGETKTRTLRSPLFPQASWSVHTPHPSLNTDVTILPSSKSPVLHISPPQALSSPFQNKTVQQDNLKLGLSQTDKVNKNNSKASSQINQNGQILLVDNRVQISSHSLQSDNTHNSSSTYVTETLVYSIKSNIGTPTLAPVYTSPTPLQNTTNATVSVETKLSQQSHTEQSTEEAGKPHRHSDQSSSGSSSAESQLLGEEGWSKKMKASVLGKSRFFSMESPGEQSSKRNRFVLKKSVSTPNPSLSRSDSERTTKSNNKMDQVLNRLRQTFSNKRSDDELSFPWKWKRASHIPSVSASSDVSSVSDNTAGCIKTLEEQERGVVPKDKEMEGTSSWTQNKCTVIPLSVDKKLLPGDQSSIWSDASTQVIDQGEENACTEHKSSCKPQIHLTVHSPTGNMFDFRKDSRIDFNPTNQFLICRDPPPGRSPNPSGGYPIQSRKSTSSPRSPFSPFSSLSPISPFSSPDVTDDSVFYSPKLHRRRDSSSPREPVEGISLGCSRRSRASTGPPSAGASPGLDSQHLASSYADLKYGIEPGKSFSVSSVLSSRASRPERISTGSRFMSVGDLSESALTCGSKNLDQWSFTPSFTTTHDCRPTINCKESFPGDPGKIRSRSLPRSLTLANWSSGVSIFHPVPSTSSRPACFWSPCHFAWDAEGPPTPPPTPPLSPVSRRMSKPSSLPSPNIPCSPGSPQPVDSQSSRGHLPSRGYVSSLSAFEESSDSSSDTTTDDEYYLEMGEEEEKETEL